MPTEEEDESRKERVETWIFIAGFYFLTKLTLKTSSKNPY